MKKALGYTQNLRNFWILWFGQSISLLGSAMTGFAITIWAYKETGRALVLSTQDYLL